MIGEFLKPPTDNLYKFMTIVGLILFLVSVTYPPWLYHRSAMASFDAERDAELLQLEMADLNEKHDRFMKAAKAEIEEDKAQIERIKQLTQEVKDGKLTAKQRNEMTQEIADIKAESEVTEKERNRLAQLDEEATDKVKKDGIALKYKARVNIWESWYGRIALLFCLAGSVVGAVIGRKGFNLWSLRVQVHQDEILRNQAKAIEPAEKSPR